MVGLILFPTPGYEYIIETKSIFIYSDSIFLLNLTNATSVQPFLPVEFETLEDFMSKGHSVLRIRPPPLKLPKIPGSFVCDSMITDQTGSPLLSWKWWYEMRGETPQVEKALMVS